MEEPVNCTAKAIELSSQSSNTQAVKRGKQPTNRVPSARPHGRCGAAALSPAPPCREGQRLRKPAPSVGGTDNLGHANPLKLKHLSKRSQRDSQNVHQHRRRFSRRFRLYLKPIGHELVGWPRLLQPQHERVVQRTKLPCQLPATFQKANQR